MGIYIILHRNQTRSFRKQIKFFEILKLRAHNIYVAKGKKVALLTKKYMRNLIEFPFHITDIYIRVKVIIIKKSSKCVFKVIFKGMKKVFKLCRTGLPTQTHLILKNFIF